MTFDSAQILDVTGPLEVFSSASRFLPAVRYRTQVVTTRGGPVRASCGLEFASSADRRRHRARRHVDGGRRRRHGRSRRRHRAARPGPTARHRRAPRDLGLLRRVRARGSRPAGGTTGHHPLGRVRTARRHLRRCHRRPRRHLRPRRQRVDLRRRHRRHRPRARSRRRRPRTPGRRHRRASAGRLPQRSGGQAQFSALLAGSSRHRAGRDLLSWLRDHLTDDLSVAALARQINLSERQFTRVFKAEVGATAADHVEAVRLESACRLLETTNRTIEQIAKTCGFGTPETMNRTFRRRLDTTPGDHRHHFRGNTPIRPNARSASRSPSNSSYRHPPLRDASGAGTLLQPRPKTEAAGGSSLCHQTSWSCAAAVSPPSTPLERLLFPDLKGGAKSIQREQRHAGGEGAIASVAPREETPGSRVGGRRTRQPGAVLGGGLGGLRGVVSRRRRARAGGGLRYYERRGLLGRVERRSAWSMLL